MTISQLAEADSRKPRIDYAIVRARLKAGEYNADLASEYGVSRAAITRGARRAGWYGPRRGQRKKGVGELRDGSKLKLLQRAHIASLARAGQSRRALAEEYGVTTCRVDQIVRQYA